jgi:hypothetical protein
MTNETKRRTRDEREIKRKVRITYVVAPIFNKCITTRFPFESSSLVKQKIELRDFSELGKDLEERISARKYVLSCQEM